MSCIFRDPNKPKVEPSSRAWPQYTKDTQEYLIIDNEDSIGQYLYVREAEFWREILPKYFEATDYKEATASLSQKEGYCKKDEPCD